MVLTHKILYHRIDLEVTPFFKSTRRPILRTRRRRNNFAWSVVNNWNRLPLTVASVTEPRKFKKQLDSCVSSYFFSLFYFRPIWFLWVFCPLPISKYSRLNVASHGSTGGLLVTEATEMGSACDSEALSAISASPRIDADAGTTANTIWTDAGSFPKRASCKKP